MSWLIGYTLFLAILKLSSQSGCPFSDYQALASNAISNAVSTTGNYIEKFVDGDKNVDDMLRGYNSGDEYSEYAAQSLMTSFEGTSRMVCAAPPMSCTNDSSNLYYRTFDGSCNNLASPGSGMANTRYGRLLRPKYGDGQYSPTRSESGGPLPGARVLSLTVFGEQTLPDDKFNVLTMQWTQFVGHDMGDLMQGSSDNCCENPNNKYCYNIPLHVYGPITLGSGRTCQSFNRAVSDVDLSCPFNNLGYAEKMNRASSYLDLSFVYGNSLEASIKLRAYQGGLLKTVWNNNQELLTTLNNENNECQSNVENCFNVGDMRNQFMPSGVVLHTLLVREHNRLANILAKMNPHYSDEKLFQEARKINIAQYQRITYYEMLPLLLGPSHTYESRLAYNVDHEYDYVNDYDERLTPVTYAENAVAAFRYLHTSIPGVLTLTEADYHRNQTLRISNYFRRQDTFELMRNGKAFDPMTRGLLMQLQKRVDTNLDKEIKHFLDRQPFDEFGTDLKSVDIQRGRDFGLPSYNDYREYCGLPRAFHWSDFSDHISPEKIELMQKFYKSPNDVDLNVAGALERHVAESEFGPTFQCLMTKQFLTTRRSDRFFFERNDVHTGFKPAQLAEIRKVTLASLICANTDLEYVQQGAFMHPSIENNMVPCKSIPQMNLGPWHERASY
ncbi:peroxidase-like [Haematobia irritans]|uniref:peroxidase-like n=1 Tax=Haematobia irritans TaxID=7368 RepID=UPI003F50B4BD